MSGIGRGRGWLNINKNMNTKPGMNSPVENTINYEYTRVTTPKPSGKYANIISKISLFNENDDGILLNQKLKHIIEEFSKDCATRNEVKEAFDDIYDYCLHDEEFASKTIGMASTQSFKSICVHDVKLRNLFVERFQQDFEASKQLQTNNPKIFRNVVKMLGDYYHKARLNNGQPFKFLSSPVLKYLHMLLESNTEADLQLFTTLIHMIGSSLKDLVPSKVMELVIQARNILAFNDKLSPVSKLWLMMAIDISNNRFSFMPNELHAFYVSHLGHTAMSQIKKMSTYLSIQTNYQTSLDSIQSNVNVLQQVCTSNEGWDSPSSTTLESDKSTAHMTNNVTHSKNISRNYKTDTGFNNIGTWEQPKNEKTPRPILGAGVRMKQTENKTAEDANWRDRKNDDWKENSAGWDNTKKGGGSGWDTGVNKSKKNISKGWEHDDRFENEYN